MGAGSHLNTVSDHVRRATMVAKRGGFKTLSKRLVRAAYQRLGVADLDFPLLPGDTADSTRLSLPPEPFALRRGTPLRIGWLTTPPSLGSGGHTTMFRMVAALEKAGHKCVIILYDRYGGDPVRQEAVIRAGWPWIEADVRSVSSGFARLDGCVATSWLTAHVLATRCALPMRRFYFVQDYEPFFYPRGSEYSLAEDTYRFGYHCIAVGHMVGDLLRAEFGVESTIAEFGCDTDVYRLTNKSNRSGVVFYTKPEVPRRGYRLGVEALTEFSRRHPEQEIHVFGANLGHLPFSATRHDRLTPDGLNDLYNKTIAGFAMSFTNISLVAEEMLAAGTIPVVNDAVYARADLPNGFARWAPATPGGLADALCELVEHPDVSSRASAAAASVEGANWEPAQEALVSVVEREIYAS